MFSHSRLSCVNTLSIHENSWKQKGEAIRHLAATEMLFWFATHMWATFTGTCCAVSLMKRMTYNKCAIFIETFLNLLLQCLINEYTWVFKDCGQCPHHTMKHYLPCLLWSFQKIGILFLLLYVYLFVNTCTCMHVLMEARRVHVVLWNCSNRGCEQPILGFGRGV